MIGDLMTPQAGFDPDRWENEKERTSVEDVTNNGCRMEHGGKRCVICSSLLANLNHHSVFLTKKGYLGVGPRYSKVGDEAWVIFGGYAPFLVRKVGGSEMKRHVMVGECYVHGVMKGEAMQDSEFLVRSRTITLN